MSQPSDKMVATGMSTTASRTLLQRLGFLVFMTVCALVPEKICFVCILCIDEPHRMASGLPAVDAVADSIGIAEAMRLNVA